MIYTLLIVLILLLVIVLVWQRQRYKKLLTYTRHSDTERLIMAEEVNRLSDELADLKETEEFITYTLHGRR